MKIAVVTLNVTFANVTAPNSKGPNLPMNSSDTEEMEVCKRNVTHKWKRVEQNSFKLLSICSGIAIIMFGKS